MKKRRPSRVWYEYQNRSPACSQWGVTLVSNTSFETFADVHCAPRSKFGVTGAGPADALWAVGPGTTADSNTTRMPDARAIPRQRRERRTDMKLLQERRRNHTTREG